MRTHLLFRQAERVGHIVDDRFGMIDDEREVRPDFDFDIVEPLACTVAYPGDLFSGFVGCR